jgi:hypothetical protein
MSGASRSTGQPLQDVFHLAAVREIGFFQILVLRAQSCRVTGGKIE